MSRMPIQFTPRETNIPGDADRVAVEVAHDNHLARFRPITVEEQMWIAHWRQQRENIETWFRDGRQEPCPLIDGNAMLPHGVEFDSTGDAVIGLNDAGQPKWVLCKECVELGAAVIRERLRMQNERIATMTMAEMLQHVAHEALKP
jgi:hypothetical protein